VRLVADANVLLSAATGGRAAMVLGRPDLAEVLTTAAAMAEVQEYVEPLARRLRLPLPTVLLAVATLPVVVVERDEYEGALAEARRRIGRRDVDDAETLALALHLDAPVWSNDSDFEDAGVEWYTTARLLKRLGLGRG
jgi:predicted nucleic acid-binding protein